MKGLWMRRPSGLRPRLLLVILLTLLPLFAMFAGSILTTRQADIDSAGLRARMLAQQGAEAQTVALRQTLNVLRMLSYIPAIANDDDAPAGSVSCSDLLTTLRSSFPWITTKAVVRPDGSIRCADFPQTNFTIADRPYFQRALASGSFAVSDLTIGRGSGRPTLVAALPILDAEGTTQFVLVAGVDLSWITLISQQAKEHAQGVVLVTDRLGYLLAHAPPINAATVTHASTGQNDLYMVQFTQLQQEATAENGTFEAVGPDGEHRIFGYARIDERWGQTGAIVAVGFLKSEELAIINQRAVIGVAMLIIITAASVLGAWVWLELSVLRWLRNLQDASRKLASGEFQPVPAPPLNDELADLTRAFNAMSFELSSMTLRDTLTDLPNRRFLQQRMRLLQAGEQPLAIAFLSLDLDGFKAVNDQFGHHAGDVLLKEVSSRLAGCLRSDDVAIRLGGDEFLIELRMPGGADTAMIDLITGRILDAINKPVDLEGLGCATVGTSIGVAIWFRNEDISLHDTLHRSDQALYAAKRSGRNQAIYWHPDMAPLEKNQTDEIETGEASPDQFAVDGVEPDRGPMGKTTSDRL